MWLFLLNINLTLIQHIGHHRVPSWANIILTVNYQVFLSEFYHTRFGATLVSVVIQLVNFTVTAVRGTECSFGLREAILVSK